MKKNLLLSSIMFLIAISGMAQTSLPFRIGAADHFLPGKKQSYYGYKWESPIFHLTEEINALRMTVFKTNGGPNATHYGSTEFMFPTFAEIEFYDGSGAKIALTADSIIFPGCYAGDGAGVAALCDGNTSTWCHGAWQSGQASAEYDENPEYQYLEITFPEPISSFKYVQYGRSNAANTPTDFVFGKAGVTITPDSVPMYTCFEKPNIYVLNYYIDEYQNIYETMEVGTDPGYYENIDVYTQALYKAREALTYDDDEIAKEAISELKFAVASLKPHPVTEGIYIFESADTGSIKPYGIKKAMRATDGTLGWSEAPSDYENAEDMYKFELISAANSDSVAKMIADSLITAEDADKMFFIKSVALGQYIHYVDGRSKAVGLNAEALAPYLVRLVAPPGFELWYPNNNRYYSEYRSLTMKYTGEIVTWIGSETYSQWKLRKLDVKTSISDLVVEGDGIVSVTYYTVAGNETEAPVKGINIVKTVYANGVVKSKKIFVK